MGAAMTLTPADVLERAAYEDALGNRRTADMLRALVTRATPEAETLAVRFIHMAYLAGFAASAEGYNAEWPFQDCAQDPEKDPDWIAARDRALSALEPAPVQGWRTDMDAIPKGVAVLAALSNGWHEIITDRSEKGDYAAWYVSHGNMSLPIERTHPQGTQWGHALRVVAWMSLPPAPQEVR